MWDAILNVWGAQRGPEPAGAHPGYVDADVGWLCTLMRCTTKAVACDGDLGFVCRLSGTVSCEGCVLWCATNLWFSRRFRTLWKHLRSCGWAVNATKIPSSKGWPRAYGGFCRSLIKILAGVELPLWRLSCSLTRADSGLDLAMEDKGTPRAVGGSSSPTRARTATWVPDDTWCWVFAKYWGCNCCVCSYCYCKMQVQGSLLPAKGLLQKMDCT